MSGGGDEKVAGRGHRLDAFRKDRKFEKRDSQQHISGDGRQLKRKRSASPNNEPQNKKPRTPGGGEEEQQFSPSSVVTGSGSPDLHPDPPLCSSDGSSISDRTSSFSDKGKDVALDLSHMLDAQGTVYEMRPEVSYTMKHLELNSKMNKELKVGLQMFNSAFMFMKTILQVRELTNEDKPSPSHD